MHGICLKLSEDCGGIENDPLFETQFIYGHFDVGDKSKQMFCLRACDANQCGARLVTPFFPMNGKKHAVLMIKYFMDGEGITSLAVVKQDNDSHVIWKSDKKSNDWQNARICIEPNSDPRFFIEAICEPGSEGTVALSKIELQYCCCINCGAYD
jgi:hypothetical protein